MRPVNCVLSAIATSLLILATAQAQQPVALCPKLFEIVKDPALEALYRDARSYWSPARMTDPKQHNPADFRYLVSMVSYRNGGTEARGKALIANPSLLKQEKHFSTSYISSQAPIETFMGSSFGVIVHVPQENIFAASPRDLIEFDKAWFGYKPADSTTENSYLRRVLTEVGIKHPDELLSYKGPRRNPWNEVLVQAETPEGGAATVAGLIVVHSSEGELKTPLDELAKNYSIIRLMQKSSVDNRLPIVRILKK